MFLYRADYLKYDFIPMNKRIRRVYGQNLNDTVCVVDPVMRGLGVDLDAVARIQAVFAAVQIYGQDTLRRADSSQAGFQSLWWQTASGGKYAEDRQIPVHFH